jgi:hypothetical protein
MAKKKINRALSKSALRKQKRIQDCARALHLRLAGNDYRSISITENVGVGEAYRRVQETPGYDFATDGKGCHPVTVN